ncbi:carbohydrate ABC transporter permease [Pseudonocardia sp. TRM90224]|uniref:carbohydrate ABC transporter permease n=1 Tax=Pseudonocardia sp. TRM90224 TaxID=2812678 RepID=UPI001E3628DD|nr:carbohydrate ABC transporter permease [Pseudonocardia sp. TRM90224]
MSTTIRPGRAARPWRFRRPGFWLLLLAASALFSYPYLWVVSASLKPRSQVFDNRLFPQEWVPSNFVTVFERTPILSWFINSSSVAIAAAAAVTTSSALVAFGFAHFRFPGRKPLFGLVLATMMLPTAVTMIPVYLIWNTAGLATTQVPLWAANLFGSAFYIFLLRQFFLGLPKELFEAARLDGASYWTIFWRIVVPLSKPALIVTFIFELKASWSDLLKPLIYLRDPALFTLPRGLKAISDQFGQSGEQQWEIVLAGSIITTLPLIIVFFIAQRYFVQGIATQARTR